MNKQTLKEIIIELREEDKSFETISNILKNDYNITMTRQAVCSMYNRATSEKSMEKRQVKAIVLQDMLEFYSLGLSTREIKEIIDYNDLLTLADIDRTIFNNELELDDIKDKYIGKIINAIKDDKDIKEIYGLLQFKGISMTVDKFDELFYEASVQYIKNNIVKGISNIYNITDNKKLAKSLCTEFGVDINLNNLGK